MAGTRKMKDFYRDRVASDRPMRRNETVDWAERIPAGAYFRKAFQETYARSAIAKEIGKSSSAMYHIIHEYDNRMKYNRPQRIDPNTAMGQRIHTIWETTKRRQAELAAGGAADLPSETATTPKGRSMAVKSITQGIWGALGGKRMRYLTHAFKVGGPAGLAVAGASMVKDAFVARASAAQQTVLSAGAAGISASQMRGLERAMQIQGAGRGSAVGLANLIQQYVTGVKLGRDPGPLKELRRIGADISPFYTFAENLENIADALSSVDKETASQIAALAGIDAGALAFLRQGGGTVGAAFNMYEGRTWVDSLGRAQVATNKLGVAMDDLQDAFLVKFAPAITWVSEALSDWAKNLMGNEEDVPVFPISENADPLLVQTWEGMTPEEKRSDAGKMLAEALLEGISYDVFDERLKKATSEAQKLQNQGFMTFMSDAQEEAEAAAKKAAERIEAKDANREREDAIKRAEENELAIQQLLKEFEEDPFPSLSQSEVPLTNDISGNLNVNIHGPAPDELKTRVHDNIIDTVTDFYENGGLFPVDLNISGAK